MHARSQEGHSLLRAVRGSTRAALAALTKPPPSLLTHRLDGGNFVDAHQGAPVRQGLSPPALGQFSVRPSFGLLADIRRVSEGGPCDSGVFGMRTAPSPKSTASTRGMRYEHASSHSWAPSPAR